VQERLLDFTDGRQARVTLHLPTIHCVACVWLLENLFRFGEGIGESRVNFARREITITFAPERVKLSGIAALLTSLGYEPALTLGELEKGAGPVRDRGRERQWLRLGIAGFGFGNIMLLALPAYLGLDSLSGPWFRSLAGWLSLVLALPVLTYSAADYWRSAWLSLRGRVLTLEVPIAIGLAAIYGWSFFEVASGRGEGYSDSLAGLIFFLLCGRLFQQKSFEHLAFDRDYKGFFPLAAVRRSRQSPDEGERDVQPTAVPVPPDEWTDESVAISELRVGDRLLIRHGELIPADARLVAGEALVDYSFVTGESEPVACVAGDHLYAGGRQMAGAIEVGTVKPVSESYLTSLWNSDAFRKEKDDELNSLTNRYSRRFTLGVMAIALAAGLFWSVVDPRVAPKAFVSVLIVACPCALALAAPLTLGTAQRWLAKRNVFLRNAAVIERMSEVDTIVLDKTGTLTVPGADRRSVHWQGRALKPEERDWFRSLCRHSTHPLAARIAEGLGGGGSSPTQSFQETPGCGMEGRLGGREIRMGSAGWLEAGGVGRSDGETGNTIAAETEPPHVGCYGEMSGSAVHVAIDGQYRGCFAVESTLRPEMDVLLQQLGGRHQLVLLSGDRARESKRFVELLGPGARVEFNQSPFDKPAVIRDLQAAGRQVMMVGDGLNDAGALRQADVGVAVVEKAGTFSPASDVILDAAQLAQLARALGFSRRALVVVRAGFVVSGLYNIVGVSIAAAGLLSPLVCAVLMPLSSVTVVLFAIGATRWMARRSFPRRSSRGNEAPTASFIRARLFRLRATAEARP